MTKSKRMLVFVHGAWHICRTEQDANGRLSWVYDDSRAFCCYLEDNKPLHKLPPKPTK